MSSEIIKVPDIGGDTDVEIIEIAVSEGDVIEAEDTLITLESDKASMDVPAPKGGKVVKVLVKEGDKVSEGDDIVELEVEGSGDAEPEAKADSAAEEAPAPKQEEAPAPAAKKPAVASRPLTSRCLTWVVPTTSRSSKWPLAKATTSTPKTR